MVVLVPSAVNNLENCLVLPLLMDAKIFNPWRLLVLKLFGGKISEFLFVHSSTKIQIPWHITMHHRACLGENVVAYSLRHHRGR